MDGRSRHRANPFNSVNNPSLTSDKQTWGNIHVDLDGTVKFGSGTPELAGPGPFSGPGAHVTLDSSGKFVCAFTVDTDLVGKPDAPKLHISGGMTAHWHPEGVGGMNCP